MMKERTIELQIRLAANQQRRRREKFLAYLPEGLRSVLERVPFIVSPELDELAGKLAIFPDGLGKDRWGPCGYRYQELQKPSRRKEGLDFSPTLGYNTPSLHAGRSHS